MRFFWTWCSNQLRNQSSKLLFLETMTLCLRWLTHFGLKLMQERVLSLHHCADGSNHLPVDDKSSQGMPWVSSPQASRPRGVMPQFAIKKIIPVECEANHKAADAQLVGNLGFCLCATVLTMETQTMGVWFEKEKLNHRAGEQTWMAG